MRFETGAPYLEWLNKTIAVATAERKSRQFCSARTGSCEGRCARSSGPGSIRAQSSERGEKDMKKYGAEFFGTFWLVLGGCGSAVLAAAFPDVGIGLLGVVAGLRPDRADHGLRHRAHLRLPPQSGGLDRPVGRRPLSRQANCCPTSSRRSWAASSPGGVLYLIASGKAGLRRRRRASPRTATARIRRAATRCWRRWSPKSS